MKSPRYTQAHRLGAVGTVGRLMAAMAMLAMLLVAPLHAVSHIGERLGSPAQTTVTAEARGEPTDHHPAEAPGERHGTPCELCLICFNGAFSAASGTESLPDQRIPDRSRFQHAEAAGRAAENAPLRHERPEVRGPPPAIG